VTDVIGHVTMRFPVGSLLLVSNGIKSLSLTASEKAKVTQWLTWPYTTSMQRSISFILVQIDSSYTTSY